MTGLRLNFAALPGDWLYDPHGQKFAAVSHGADAATGFAPLYLGGVFGVPVKAWTRFLVDAREQIDALPHDERSDWLEANRPKGSTKKAAEVALLVYPEMERFYDRSDGELGPIALRSRYLHQPNVPLGQVALRGGELQVPEHPFENDAARRTLASKLRSHAAPAGPAPRSGIYLLGHSSVLIRSAEGGLLIDPLAASPMVPKEGIDLGRIAPLTTAVAVTHSHYDHYHLPTLLALSSRPVIIPRVPRPSIICEDMEARLRSFDAPLISAPAWGEWVEIDDLRVHVLPFVGEQFLTAEHFPEARNWGNCYVVEAPGFRVLVAADGGFEPGRSIIDEVEKWVASHGPIDIVITQSIGLRCLMAGGDPDLALTALTCPHRAPSALELLLPERRVTLSVADVPRLVSAARARALIPYGQFQLAPGEPAVHRSVVHALRLALEDSDCTVLDVPIGGAYDPTSREIVPDFVAP